MKERESLKMPGRARGIKSARALWRYAFKIYNIIFYLFELENSRQNSRQKFTEKIFINRRVE